MVTKYYHKNYFASLTSILTHGAIDELLIEGTFLWKFTRYTGKTTDRPALNRLLKKLGRGDKLIVTKMDRFARTATEGGALVRDLQERGVVIHILNMGLIDESPIGNLMVNMLLAFAQFEREMIVERTQTGKALARARGKRVDGRPKKFTKTQLDHAMNLLESHSYSEVSELTTISVSTLVREKERRLGKEIIDDDGTTRYSLRAKKSAAIHDM